MALVTGLPCAAAPVPLEALVVGDARASAAERVAIYQHMYRARVVDALASQYPCVARALGTEAFADAVERYLQRCPSTHPSIRELGRAFAAHVAASAPPPETVEPLPPSPTLAALAALADLARLEWARAEVFDDFDDELVTVDDLRAVAAEAFAALPLRRVRASRLIALEHEVAAWWAELAPPAGDPETTAPSPHVCGGGAPPLPIRPASVGRQVLLVWREGVSVYHRAVSGAEERALRALEGEGIPFGAICDELAALGEPEEDVVTLAFGWLWTWSKDGLLCG